MTRFVTRALVVAAATVGILFAQIAPASATVHEIVGQWCSGQPELAPRGITGGSNANNFAKPLEASGFVGDPVRDPRVTGWLVEFNYDNPNVKVVGTGDFVQIGEFQGEPLFIELIEPDPNFPAFQERCPRLAG